jgi:menaquinone-dependent protoporphyrinogen oxidase
MQMTEKVLIAYATKHGATTEIADKIAETLVSAGVHAVALPVEHIGDLNAYSTVVLGSAVYAGHWCKEATAFLKTHKAQLAQRPVWIFSSGPTGEGDPAELMQGWRFPQELLPVIQHIHPRDIVLFHGEIDDQKLNLMEKVIVKGVKAPLGDYRNWHEIIAWAERIAESLKQPVAV